VVIADKFAPDANTQIVAADAIPDGWMVGLRPFYQPRVAALAAAAARRGALRSPAGAAGRLGGWLVILARITANQTQEQIIPEQLGGVEPATS
jgi:hypothetical protein